MKSLDDLFRNQRVELVGAWMPLAGGETKVRHLQCPEYVQKRRQVERTHRGAEGIRQEKPLGPDVEDMLFRKALAGTVAANIRGYKIDVSKLPADIPPPSPELIANGELVDCVEAISWLINNLRQYRDGLVQISLADESFDADKMERIGGN